MLLPAFLMLLPAFLIFMSAWRECAECFCKIESLSGRKEIVECLGEYFSSLSASDLVCASYLSIARVSPEAEGAEMNIGESILLKAINSFSSIPAAVLREKYKSLGDISLLLNEHKSVQMRFTKRKTLLLSEVFLSLKRVSLLAGKESIKRKVEEISLLLSKCTDRMEVKYIIRILDGKLKIGVSIQSVLAALGIYFYNRNSNTKIENTNTETDGTATADNSTKMENASTNSEIDSVTDRVKKAYSQLPSLEKIIDIFSREGALTDNDLFVTPGHPLRPMLAIPEKDIASVISRFKDSSFLAEYKYDGERVQVHRTSGEIKLFSRGLENTTERFFQVKQMMGRSCREEGDFILDAEAVAYSKEEKKILDFQVLSNRKRKLKEDKTDKDGRLDNKDTSKINANEAKTSNKINGQQKKESDIALFIFDILYFNCSLVKLSILERKKAIKRYFAEVPDEVFIVEATVLKQPEEKEIERIFNSALSFGCEGLMLKSTGDGSTYEPSKRSQKWIKLKSDYLVGLYDTLDLIVLGAYTGKGKRTGVHGGFLLGCMNRDKEVETVTKIGTGFSDAVLKEHMYELAKYKTDTPSVKKSSIAAPDVWFKPCVVWEISSAGISLSPTYTAGRKTGMLPEGKGLSLRFPRFTRRREDKLPEDSSRSEDILAIYLGQFQANPADPR